MKTIEITDTIQAALDAVKEAERGYVVGRDPALPIELLKLDLADAVLAAAARIERLPDRSNGIVYVKLQRSRRKPA
jgi:hypothetical protein